MEKPNEKILVTGANGFLGKAIIDELLNTGVYETIAFTGRRGLRRQNMRDNLRRIYPVDVADESTFPESTELAPVAALVHSAGLAHQFGNTKREDFWEVNVRGTANICRLALKIGVRHFVLISSVAVYGAHSEIEVDEATVCQPEGFYAESKYEAEKIAAEICAENKIKLTILRPVTIIGEGDRGNMMRLITQIDRRRFFWIGSGGNQKSLIYKGDAARAVLRAIERAPEGELCVYNLSGVPVRMREIVETIETALQRKIPPGKIPAGFLRTFLMLRKIGIRTKELDSLKKTLEKWLASDVYSGKKFYADFDFECRTPVRAALNRQVEWYKRKLIN